MTDRIGTCTSCSARYRIPEHVTATRLKCKKCEGVVEIGVGKKKTAPPQAKAPAPKKRVKSASAPAAATAASDEGDVAGEKPARRAKRSRSERSSKRSGSRSGKSGRRRRRGEQEPEEKAKRSPMLWVVLAIVVIGGGAAAYFLLGGDEPETTVDGGEGAPTVTETAAEPATDSTEDPEPSTQEPIEDLDTPVEAPSPEEPAAEEAPEPVGPSLGETMVDHRTDGLPDGLPDVMPVLLKNAKEVDIKQWPLLGRWGDTSEEDWQYLNEDMQLFLDPYAGANGDRAGRRLVKASRKAMPVIINALLTIDYNDREQHLIAGTIQEMLLMKISSGTNLGWKSISRLYPGEEGWEDAVLYNKKIAVGWYRIWATKLAVDDAQWDGFVKRYTGAENKKEPPKKPARASRDDDLLDEFDD